MLEPQPADFCNLSPSEKPRLVVVIDTEEEFDWSKEFSRDNTSVSAMQSIGRIQDVFDEFGITPVYVIDYPVASQESGYRILKDIHADGRCLIGAHLHPWVTPPHQEQVNVRNSFPGNLPRELEAEKLERLGDCIEETFGARPVLYKAGRYGIGLNTADILEQQGYEVDLSVRAHANFSAIDGPNFTYKTAWPYWFGTNRRLLELPLSAGFTGLLRTSGASLQGIAARPALASLHLAGILNHLGLVRSFVLSPESSSLSQLIEITRVLYRDGLRIFGMAFHSPSLEPGHTPYVRTQQDLEDFLARCRGFFEWFLNDLGGLPSQPLELKALLASSDD